MQVSRRTRSVVREGKAAADGRQAVGKGGECPKTSGGWLENGYGGPGETGMWLERRDRDLERPLQN